MTAWTLRPAVSGDAPGLAACMRAAYAPFAREIENLPPLTADYAEEIATAQVWVAAMDDRIVGGLILVAEAEAMVLANVAVHPDCSGQGLGRTLIDHAEAEARVQGYRELRLNTPRAMPGNVVLYEHLGWQQTGVSGDTIAMSKVLGD